MMQIFRKFTSATKAVLAHIVILIRDGFERLDGKQLSTFLACMTLVAIGLFLVLAVVYGVMRVAGVKGEELGVFGDFVGGSLNPFLSFLSLIAILFTIVLQNRELAATRKEMEASRKAQEYQASGLQKQISIAENREKADLTFKMLDRWSSSGMRSSRLDSWRYLSEFVIDNPASRIDPTHLEQADVEVFRAFTDVCQFISDLKRLIEADKLDEDLTYTLFVSSLSPWFRFVDLVEVSPAKTKSEDRTGFNDQNTREVQAWYCEVYARICLCKELHFLL